MLELLMLLNAERATTLMLDTTLTQKAEIRAEMLCERGQWSHEGWGGIFADLPYRHKGENLARGFKTNAKTHAGLMKSAKHRRNIEDENYKKVGIAKIKCGKKWLVVELFAG